MKNYAGNKSPMLSPTPPKRGGVDFKVESAPCKADLKGADFDTKAGVKYESSSVSKGGPSGKSEPKGPEQRRERRFGK